MDYIEEDWMTTVIIIGVCLMATAYMLVVLRCCFECVKVLFVQRYGETNSDKHSTLDESGITVVSEDEYHPIVNIVLPIEKDGGLSTPRWI